MPSSVAALDVTDIVLLLVAIRFIPSTDVVDDIVPRLLKLVSDIFQLFEDVAEAELLLELEEELLEEPELLELLLELEEELLLEGHCASSKYQIWFADCLFVY